MQAGWRKCRQAGVNAGRLGVNAGMQARLASMLQAGVNAGRPV